MIPPVTPAQVLHSANVTEPDPAYAVRQSAAPEVPESAASDGAAMEGEAHAGARDGTFGAAVEAALAQRDANTADKEAANAIRDEEGQRQRDAAETGYAAARTAMEMPV